MTPHRILASAVAALAALALTGCALLAPAPDAPATPSAATPSADAQGEPGAPSDAESGIVVLSDDDVTDVVEFTRSEPAGTWPVGPGVPPGFPAGVPVFSDRWIKNNVVESTTSAGLPSYSAMFWGGYADLDKLAVHFEELGFSKDQQQDDTKRVIIYQNERYRVIINASESTVDPQSKELLDPAYTMLVISLD